MQKMANAWLAEGEREIDSIILISTHIMASFEIIAVVIETLESIILLKNGPEKLRKQHTLATRLCIIHTTDVDYLQTKYKGL